MRGMISGQRCAPDNGGTSRPGNVTRPAFVYDCGSENELSRIEIFENLIEGGIRTYMKDYPSRECSQIPGVLDSTA